jgi:hypothetical protein
MNIDDLCVLGFLFVLIVALIMNKYAIYDPNFYWNHLPVYRNHYMPTYFTRPVYNFWNSTPTRTSYNTTETTFTSSPAPTEYVSTSYATTENR